MSASSSRRILSGRGIVTSLLVGAVASFGMVFAAPVVAPQAFEAQAAPCRNVVVPGSGAVAKQCNTTPLPEGARKCMSGVAAGVAAGARTGGKKGAVAGLVSGGAACAADAIDGG